jgi:hypothetical protein
MMSVLIFLLEILSYSLEEVNITKEEKKRKVNVISPLREGC